MEKPVFKKGSFSVDDIHKLREYHYEQTKNMTDEEYIKDVNEKAEKFKKELEKAKRNKIAI